MWYSLSNGGKRLRPVILAETSKALGLKKSRYLNMMLATELIHCYSLVHDDLPSMDDDDYRRGKLSTHKKFNEAQAILSGNGLLTLAFELLSKKYDSKISHEISKVSGAYVILSPLYLISLMNLRHLKLTESHTTTLIRLLIIAICVIYVS